jgi:hypothetical protein
VVRVTAWDTLPTEQRNRPGTGFSTNATLTAWVAELSLAVLGALTITSEYASGMIRTTLTVMPARRAVLAAKAAAVAAVAGVAGQAAVLAAFFVTWLIVDGRPIRGQPTSIAGEVPLLFALGLEVAMFALLGPSLGAIMRSAAAAIATLLGLWYLGPMIAANLPSPWDDRISSFLARRPRRPGRGHRQRRHDPRSAAAAAGGARGDRGLHGGAARCRTGPATRRDA